MERPSFPRDEQRPPGNGAGWDQGAEQIPDPSPGAGGGWRPEKGREKEDPSCKQLLRLHPSGMRRKELDLPWMGLDVLRSPRPLSYFCLLHLGRSRESA